MYILFDIGGTKMRVASSLDCKRFAEPMKMDTPKTLEEGVREIKRIAQELSQGEKVHGVGGGITGVLDPKREELTNSFNLPGWAHKPLKRELEKALDAPVALQNDTAIVGLGEAHYGAGKGSPLMVYVTVSTGVGGVRVVEGKIDTSYFGFEPGHQIIDMNGDACIVCNKSGHKDGRGHLEGYVSGTAVQERFGKEPYEIPQEDSVWEELAEWLAIGLTNTIMHWSPQTLVLGGSMIVGNPAISFASIEKHLKHLVRIFPETPVLKKAELGDIGGLYGAMTFLDQFRTQLEA